MWVIVTSPTSFLSFDLDSIAEHSNSFVVVRSNLQDVVLPRNQLRHQEVSLRLISYVLGTK